MKKLLKDCLFILFVVTILFFVSDQPSFSQSLKFVQLSDTHYSTIRNDTSYKLLSKTKPLLEDAVSQINAARGINFVVITGDVIDRPEKNSLYEATNILNTLKYRWYYVIGNHDTDPNGFLNKKKMIELLHEQNKNYNFNSTYYTFKPKRGFTVIVMDGAKEDKMGSNGIIPKEELSWLDNILAKSQKDTVLIFIHFPIVQPFDSPNHKILNEDEFKAVLKKYNMPIGIFSGHYHMTKITKRGNILHVSTPSLAGYPNSFRIVNVQNKRNKVIFKLDFKETGLKDLQAKTKIMTLGGARYYGKESDRNAVIIIDKKR